MGAWQVMSTEMLNFYIHCIVYQEGVYDVLYMAPMPTHSGGQLTLFQ